MEFENKQMDTGNERKDKLRKIPIKIQKKSILIQLTESLTPFTKGVTNKLLLKPPTKTVRATETESVLPTEVTRLDRSCDYRKNFASDFPSPV